MTPRQSLRPEIPLSDLGDIEERKSSLTWRKNSDREFEIWVAWIYIWNKYLLNKKKMSNLELESFRITCPQTTISRNGKLRTRSLTEKIKSNLHLFLHIFFKLHSFIYFLLTSYYKSEAIYIVKVFWCLKYVVSIRQVVNTMLCQILLPKILMHTEQK